MNKFSDLVSWKLANKLAVEIYKTTQTFPNSERFGITSQLRRAAVSVSSNIAEGFGRESTADKINFYVVARGSIYEVQSQLHIAKGVGLLSNDGYRKIAGTSSEALKLLHGLIKSTRNRLTAKSNS